MANNHAMVLYQATYSDMSFERVEGPKVQAPEPSFVRKEAEAVVEKPVALLPPRFNPSASKKPTARARIAARLGVKMTKLTMKRPTTGALAPKRATFSEEGSKSYSSSSKTTPPPTGAIVPLSSSSSSVSSSTLPSHSYTIIGVAKPRGGYAKGLMRKEKPTPNEKSVSTQPKGK